nr:MAG TPA: hypothetical protein [Caudoviricetes sp.]
MQKNQSSSIIHNHSLLDQSDLSYSLRSCSSLSIS